MAVKVQVKVFWVVTPCNVANVSEDHAASIFRVKTFQYSTEICFYSFHGYHNTPHLYNKHCTSQSQGGNKAVVASHYYLDKFRKIMREQAASCVPSQCESRDLVLLHLLAFKWKTYKIVIISFCGCK